MTRSAFQQALVQHFNEDELRTLAFELGVEHDKIPAIGREAYARELISYCERRSGCIERLIELCKRERPEVDWSYKQTRLDKVPQAAQKILLLIIFVLSVLIIFIVASLYINNISTFNYVVHVVDQETDKNISGAIVTIEVPGQAPLDEVTGNDGIAIIGIPSSYAGKTGKLIIDPIGAEIHRQTITLVPGSLPDIVPIVRRQN